MSEPSGMSSAALEGAYREWCAEAGAVARQQLPVRELMAEHYLMRSVLLSMQEEARKLLGGTPLRPAFWSGVIDFNGNFVHLCHRVKEEKLFIPALVESGLLAPGRVEVFTREHTRGKDYTLEIRDGVEEGDWEKVMRLVVMYVHFLELHMRQEQEELFRVAEAELPAERSSALRQAFDELNGKALAEGGREAYLELARRLAAANRVDYAL